MFISVTDSKDDEQTILINTSQIVCIGRDTAYGRYKTMIELSNQKIVFTNDPLEDVQKLVSTTKK